MEISAFVIYLISIADNVDNVFLVTLLAGIATWIVACVIAMATLETNSGEMPEEISKSLIKMLKIGLFIFLIGVIGRTFTPSSKAVAAIYVIPKIVNNETLQAEANEFYLMAKDWLKTTLEDKKDGKMTNQEKRELRKNGNKKVEKKEADTEELEV